MASSSSGSRSPRNLSLAIPTQRSLSPVPSHSPAPSASDFYEAYGTDDEDAVGTTSARPYDRRNSASPISSSPGDEDRPSVLKRRSLTTNHTRQLSNKSVDIASPNTLHGYAFPTSPSHQHSSSAQWSSLPTQEQPDDIANLTVDTSMLAGGSTESFSDEQSAYPPQSLPRTRPPPSPTPSRVHLSVLDSAASELRRMSLRVVNLGSVERTPSPTRSARKFQVKLQDQGDMGNDDDSGDDEQKSTQKKEHSNEPEPIFEDQLEEEQIDSMTEPLRGKSLGIFGPTNPIRKAARAFLLWKWTEITILLLIITDAVVLTLQSARNVYIHPRPTTAGYFFSWEDTVLFIIMCIFSAEILLKVIVSGLFFSPDEDEAPTSNVKRMSRLMNRLSTHIKANLSTNPPAFNPRQQYRHDRVRSFASSQIDLVTSAAPPAGFNPILNTKQSKASMLRPAEIPFVRALQSQRTKLHHTAYLRHSWNRVDLVAVTSFWIAFFLSYAGIEDDHKLYIFRALSVLRCTRLLTITSGTTVILQSLKIAMPLLVEVLFFVTFAMTLFSIIGVQSFKGSFRRYCVWIDPTGVQNFTTEQHCGGWFDSSGTTQSYIAAATDEPVTIYGGAKGFICPLGQVCLETGNPQNGTQSFDNILASLQQVVVIASANTWTDIEYQMMDSDFFVSCFFFIICLIVLAWWLLQVFVAVITNTFDAIRDNSKQSAFTATKTAAVDSINTVIDAAKATARRRHGLLKTVYDKTRYFWVAVILANVAVQATRRDTMPPSSLKTLDRVELYFTIGLDVEMVIRLLAYLPKITGFFSSPANYFDLFLAIVTTFIQLPFIHDTSVYPWLTAFQIARFWRVIVAFPRMKPLLLKVVGSAGGMINMIAFLLLMNFLVALIGAQFLRGVIPQEADGDSPEMTFYQINNAFLAMYQILSSENWTDVLYAATAAEAPNHQAVLGAIFLSAWFMFANAILIQMFIAVLNEGFAVAEEQKRKAQLDAFIKNAEPKAVGMTWLSKWNPYKYTKPKTDLKIDTSHNLMLPVGQTTVRDYLSPSGFATSYKDKATQQANTRLRKALGLPDDAASPGVKKSVFTYAGRHVQEHEMDDEALEAFRTRRAEQVQFMAAHPSYDRSLWIFPQGNPIRTLCQKLVDPAYGERINGSPANPTLARAFKLLILAVIGASVTIAGIANPVYRRSYFMENGDIRLTWFNLSEVALGMFFIVEFLIKVIADGFAFSPNAYILSIWNEIDFFVLLTQIVNIITALLHGTGISRLTRALKAFRALRLINLTDRMRQTFYDVLIVGASKIIDASILTVLYIIPFAVWGQNIFSGLLYSCNDSDVATKAECIGEFMTTNGQWTYLAPRVWQNPQVWSFDSFRQSLLILFEIISLEGWIDVMTSGMQIVGQDQQSSQDAHQFNSIYFVIYNLLGAVLIMTLFVSIIIENFTARSGAALLTTEQRQWIDLRKLLLRQRPAKRPARRPRNAYRAWCWERATQKHGWWSKMLTSLYVLHILLLATQYADNPTWTDNLRDLIFLFLTLIYAVDIFVRVSGLGWMSYSQNGWNIYDVIVVTGSFATTIPVLLNTTNQSAIQLQKLFLVSIAFKLVQKNNSLNQLFKNSAASLPALSSIIGLWLTLYFVWAILFLEVFSLTRWELNETWNANFSTFPKTMVLLVLMATGEGWNAFMHDYTVEPPYCTESNISFFFSDCGSPAWAFVLFISWNVLAMFIFVNMLTGVVVENFSYVMTMGKEMSINREEMRKFKLAWSMFVPSKNGRLKRHQIIPFLSSLSGVFEVKIYPDDFRVPAILQSLRSDSQIDFKDKSSSEFNIQAVNDRLDMINFEEIAQRRKTWNLLYNEALIVEEHGKGITFSEMLLLLAHYKLINDEEALQLDELLARRSRLEQITDNVNLDRVRGMLRTLYWRRQFLAKRRARRQAEAGVPALIVEAAPQSPPIDEKDISFASVPPSPTTPRTATPNSSRLTPTSPTRRSHHDHRDSLQPDSEDSHDSLSHRWR